MANVYRYQAINSQGKQISGTISADSDKLAKRKLKEENLIPLKINTISKKIISNDKSSITRLDKKIALQELALFTRELSALLMAGLEVEQSLFSMANQLENKRFKNILAVIHAQILEGYSLSSALNSFSKAFPEVYRATMRAAEDAGRLAEVLSHLAEYLEKQLSMRQKIIQALIYPIILTLVGLSIVAFLLTYVVPAIMTVFEDSQQELPFVTIILIKLSSFIKSYGMMILLLLVPVIYAIKRIWQVDKIKEKGQKYILKTPLLGNMTRLIQTERFLRTLGILIQANVPILEALHMSSHLISVISLQKKLIEAKQKVKDGATLRVALNQTHYFTPSSLQFIASGEATGNLGMMLEQAANNQQRIVNFSLETFLALFEPLMILMMGCLVLFIVLAILLPMFELSKFVG